MSDKCRIKTDITFTFTRKNLIILNQVISISAQEFYTSYWISAIYSGIKLLNLAFIYIWKRNI